jgi:hypothetical protein
MTNITPGIQDAFDALISGKYNNFCLFSCYVNGEPASAICAVDKDGEDYLIRPMFVSITPGMRLVDHEGTASSGSPPAN